MTKIADTARVHDNLSLQAERLERALADALSNLKAGQTFEVASGMRMRLAAMGIINRLGARDYARPAGDPRFFAILKELADLHAKKGADYGTKVDYLANLRASEAFGIPAWVGATIRCNDKMRRVQSFIVNGKLANESIEDALIDGAAYFVLALLLFREGSKPAA